MGTVITAIYENGLLRPLSPLDLPENARVEIQIALPPARVGNEREKVREALRAAGILGASPAAEVGEPVTDEQLEEAGRALAAGGPLSELIIAEREGR